MSQDRQAVIWTRLGQKPMRMGYLYVTDTENRFSYDPEFLATGLPGLGVIYRPDIIGHTSLVRPRSEYFDLPPPLQSLIPPRDSHNFQRQLVLNYLHSQGITPAKGFDTDWEILMVSGHGGIGHLDVFASDDKASEWYGHPADSQLFAIDDKFGLSLKSFITWMDDDAGAMLQMMGPTPSVGGAIPKLLVSIPACGWDGRIGLPTRKPDPELTDVVLKFEKTTTYPGITELEALGLDVHKQAGFQVPRYWTTRINDIPAIAIERFDRQQGRPMFSETLYSILASGDRHITSHYSYSYDKICSAIDRSPIDIVTDRAAGKLHLLNRLLLALLTGNGDLHLENLSVISKDHINRFSPVYDPTPMRAYPLHNMLSVMPFGYYGEYIGRQDKPVGLRQALLNFARNSGIRKTDLIGAIEKSLDITADYVEKVASLKTLPEANRQQLISVTQRCRSEIEGLCP